MIVRGLLHLHTTVSKDATLTHDDHVRHARAEGLDFLLFGEHREEMTDDEVRETVARCDALSEDGLLLVPGQEQETDEPEKLHVLGLGVREPIAATRPRAVVREIRAAGGISILAHPFRYRRKTLDEAFLADLDGFEGWNLRYDGRVGVREEVRTLVARFPEALALAGLDAHDPADLEQAAAPVLAVDVPRLTEAGLLDAIRAGRFTCESAGEPLELRRRASAGRRARAALHRGAFAVARGLKRGLARIGFGPPEGLVRRVRRRF